VISYTQAEFVMITAKSVDRICKRRGAVLTIASDASVVQAAVTMEKCQLGCLPVLNVDGKLVGIISERDIVTKVWPAATAATRSASRK